MEKFERRGRCKYCGFISSYEPICSYEAKKIITNSHKYDVYILCHNCEREFASTIANGLEIKSTCGHQIKITNKYNIPSYSEEQFILNLVNHFKYTLAATKLIESRGFELAKLNPKFKTSKKWRTTNVILNPKNNEDVPDKFKVILKASDKVSDSIIVFLTPEEVSMIDGEWKLYLTKIKHDILKLEELIKKYPEEIKKYPKEIKKFLDKKGINMPKSTRKICKRNGKAEKILQKIEDILSKNGMQLGFDDSSLIIKSDDFIYKSTDLENGDNTSCLPREMDSERLVLIEENDYI